MWKLLAAALIGCCFFANAQSQPVKAVGNDAAKVCDDSTCASDKEKHENTAPADSPAPEGLRVEKTAPLEQNHGSKHQQKANEIDSPPPKKDGDSSRSVPYWVAIAGGVGSIISAVMAGVLAVLGFYSWRTSKAAVDISQSALSASTITSRAYVKVNKVQLGYSSLEPSVKLYIDIQNFGATPASIYFFRCEYGFSKTAWVRCPSISPPPYYLGAGQTHRAEVSFTISQTEVDEVLSGGATLFLQVRTDYNDIFGKASNEWELFQFEHVTAYGFFHAKGQQSG